LIGEPMDEDLISPTVGLTDRSSIGNFNQSSQYFYGPIESLTALLVEDIEIQATSCRFCEWIVCIRTLRRDFHMASHWRPFSEASLRTAPREEDKCTDNSGLGRIASEVHCVNLLADSGFAWQYITCPSLCFSPHRTTPLSRVFRASGSVEFRNPVQPICRSFWPKCWAMHPLKKAPGI
jgi:hypothetical protein